MQIIQFQNLIFKSLKGLSEENLNESNNFTLTEGSLSFRVFQEFKWKKNLKERVKLFCLSESEFEWIK